MIRIRRALLAYDDIIITVLDMGHGTTFKVIDDMGAPLVQETIKFNEILRTINAMSALVTGKNIKLDVFMQFITNLEANGYRVVGKVADNVEQQQQEEKIITTGAPEE